MGAWGNHIFESDEAVSTLNEFLTSDGEDSVRKLRYHMQCVLNDSTDRNLKEAKETASHYAGNVNSEAYENVLNQTLKMCQYRDYLEGTAAAVLVNFIVCGMDPEDQEVKCAICRMHNVDEVFEDIKQHKDLYEGLAPDAKAVLQRVTEKESVSYQSLTNPRCRCEWLNQMQQFIDKFEEVGY